MLILLLAFKLRTELNRTVAKFSYPHTHTIKERNDGERVGA